MWITSVRELQGTVDRSRVRSVDFRGKNIGPEGAVAVAERLQGCTGLRELRLDDNGIGPEGAVAVAGALRGCTGLQVLYLDGNGIGPEGAAAVAGALERCTELKDLSLDDNGIGPEGAAAVAGALERCTGLQVLYLQNNSIGTEGAVAVAGALRGCTGLQVLYLQNNSIGPAGVQHLRDMFKQVTMLKTDGNELTPEAELEQPPSLLAKIARLQQEVHGLQAENIHLRARVSALEWAAETGTAIQEAASQCTDMFADCPLSEVSAVIERAAADRAVVSEVALGVVLDLGAASDFGTALAEAQAAVLEQEEAMADARREREAFVAGLPAVVMAGLAEKVDAMVSGRKTLAEVSESVSPALVAMVLGPVWELIERERSASAALAVARPKVEVLQAAQESDVVLAPTEVVAGVLCGVIRAAAAGK